MLKYREDAFRPLKKKTTKNSRRAIKRILSPVDGGAAMSAVDEETKIGNVPLEDPVVPMTVIKKPLKKTSPNDGIDSYSGVEILRPVGRPSISPARIAQAVRDVMDNDKALKK